MVESTRFSPGCTGWVVRTTSYPGGRRHVTWWYGPAHGWGRTSAGLNSSVAVWPTKKAAEEAIRSVYGRRPQSHLVERVADAVAFAIEECGRRKADVLEGLRAGVVDGAMRKYLQGIADANDRHKSYLQGKRKASR